MIPNNRPLAQASQILQTGLPTPTLTAQVSLLYGTSGTYKTTQVGKFAEYIAEVTSGRILRVVSAESAGAEPLHPYIEMGMIEVLWLSRDMFPRSAIRKLSRGAWPIFENGIPKRDSKTGELIWIEPDVKSGKLIPDHIGGYAFEGLTSFSDIMSQQLKTFGAASGGDKTGLAGAGYTEAGETFGSGSQSQVGSVQDTIMELLREAPKNLYARSNGRIVHVLFTAHESKGSDEMTSQPIYGPGTAGKAITGKLFKEVGTAIHLETEIVQEKDAASGKQQNVQKVWAYFRKHPDSVNPNIQWDCKPRIPATKEAHQEMEKRFPGGRFELTFEQSIVDYLHLQDKVHTIAMEELAKRRASFMAGSGGGASAPAPTSPTSTNHGSVNQPLTKAPTAGPPGQTQSPAAPAPAGPKTVG